MLQEARSGIVREAELHSVWVKLGNELHNIKDTDGRFQDVVVEVVSLPATSNADLLCFLGRYGNYEFVA